MEPTAYSLEEIEIMGTKTGTRLRNDKVEFIPNSSHLINTATALDLLQKVPTIVVNKADNTIRVGGDKNTLVLVNGNLTNRNIEAIRAEDIEKIEIIKNPPAKYDFDVTTVLNIIIKENVTKGVRVLLRTSASAINFRSWNNLQIDYETDKVRFFFANRTDYDIFKMHYTEKISANFENTFFETNTNTLNPYRSKSLSSNIQYGFDYSPNKNSFFNFTGNFAYSNASIDNLISSIFLVNSIESDNYITYSENIYEKLPHNFTLIYKRTFNNKHELSFNNNFYIERTYNRNYC